MIFQKELSASLRNEQGEDVLVFHRNEVSLLQPSTQATGEKLNNLLDSSERVLDNCAGGLYNFKDEWQKDGGGKGNKPQDQQQGGHGHRRSGGKANYHRGPRPVVPHRSNNNQNNNRKHNRHSSGNVNSGSHNVGGGNNNPSGHSSGGSGGSKKNAWAKPAN
jgi:hypothetical protein